MRKLFTKKQRNGKRKPKGYKLPSFLTLRNSSVKSKRITYSSTKVGAGTRINSIQKKQFIDSRHKLFNVSSINN